MVRRSSGTAILLVLLMVASTAAVAGGAAGAGASHPSPVNAEAASHGSATAVAPAVSPPAAPAIVPVGGGPDAVLADPANGSVFVASQYGNNVSEIAISNGEVIATIPVGSDPSAQGLALDPTNWTVYVANSGSDNVSVISIADQYVTASIPVGVLPNAVVVNPANKEIYVSNGGSGTVSIISASQFLPRVIDTVPVGPDPDALAVDPVTHNVFVATAGTDNVSVISGATNTVLRTVTVGSDPGAGGAMVYDPEDGHVFVANVGSNNVSVLWGSNGSLNATIPVGTGPMGLAIDPAAKELFVANHYSDNVSVISTVTNEVVATIRVGEEPATNGAIAYSSVTGYIYVPNGGSGNVSVILGSTNSIAGSINVGDQPDAIAVDPDNSTPVYVANEGSSNVDVLILTEVTFTATGLPSGSSWSVSLGSPPVVRSDVTVRSKGTILALVQSGLIDYTISGPAGYAVSKVTGPLQPTQSSANASGSKITLAVKFGHVETLTFSETGLPPDSPWGVSLRSALHHGGPAGQSNSTTGSSVGFTIVQGSWKFVVTGNPTTYGAKPGHGTLTVPDHALTKNLKFKLVTATVTFRAVGLGAGTPWDVNLTGPMDESVRTTSPTIKFHLVNGTYTYSVSNFTFLHPHPASGTFVVVAPHALPQVLISFTTAAGHGAVGRSLGGLRLSAVGPEALLAPSDSSVLRRVG